MQHYYKLLGSLERAIARRQGKGWGSGSISHELDSLASLLHSAKPVELAIDVGGNVGNYTAGIRSRFPAAEVHTFEPASTNLALLENRFADDEKVSLQPFALSNTEASATLYADTPGSGLGSLSRRRLEHRGNSFDHSESIQTRTFEPYWQKELRSRDIDILKLDIEGHELDALAGCGDALRHTRVVQFEFGGCNIDTRTFFQDFWYFFTELDFSLYRIAPGGIVKLDKYRERDEFFSTTNYIAQANSEGRLAAN